mgnify:CR=1 FL=1
MISTGTSPKPNQFKNVREKALRNWLKHTGRQTETYRGVTTDHFNCGYECEWQNLSRAIYGHGYHVSIFCSMGEWASNVTDMLTDTKYDKLKFNDLESQKILFRYYSRFISISMSIFEDFTVIIQKADIKLGKQDKARNRLSSDVSLINFANFTNHIVKHKAGTDENSPHLHYCNHHLKKHFEDSGIDCPYFPVIKIGSCNVTNPDAICIPSITQIVDMLLYAYQITDEIFKQEDQVAIKNIAKVYGKASQFKNIYSN